MTSVGQIEHHTPMKHPSHPLREFTRFWAVTLTLALIATLAGHLASAAAGGGDRGPVTNLPLPRYVSLKAGEGNVRRGPSMSHRIDWIYTRRALPLQVTAEFGHWRQVRDRDGAGGWVHYSLLSGVRTVLVEKDMAALRVQPSENAATVARTEAGVVARLGKCTVDWCRVTAGREKGWIAKTEIWGVDPGEVRD